MTGIADLMQSSIVQTVALGAAILGVVSGVLGTFAVLRRQSLLGDALSHAALPGVCLGFLISGTRDIGSILGGALFTGALAALSLVVITRWTRLKSDAALGIVLSVFFAVGIVLLTHVQNRGGSAQAGLSTFLFGQSAAMLRSDLWVMGGVTALALAIVVGLQMVGVVLMVAMLIAPAAAARQWVNGLGAMVALSAAFGVVAGVTGAVISATARGLATGPLIVLIASALVLVSLLLAPERGLLWQGWRRWTQARTMEREKVLLTLYSLGEAHADPAYPAERGMIDAAQGAASRTALARLQAEGLVAPVRHQPETTPHWELTEAGRSRARAALTTLRQEPGA